VVQTDAGHCHDIRYNEKLQNYMYMRKNLMLQG